MTRSLSPYESNHLLRFGYNPQEIDQYGEKPVEYITGHVTFKNQDFLIDDHTLIPRLETEELVDQAGLEIKKLLSHDQQRKSPITVADVGTGCGAIAVSVLLELLSQKLPMKLEFWLSDISDAALAMAEQNLQRLLPDFRQTNTGQFRLKNESLNQEITLTILTSDVMVDFPQITFDLILANLPYIPTDRISVLDSSVKDFEPHLALDGGEQGLDLIHQLLDQAHKFLAPQGKIMLEIDYTHTQPEITSDPSWKVEMQFDSFHRQRFAVVTHASPT